MDEGLETVTLDESTDVEITSGVSAFTGEPFCQVIINGVARGQMTPTEVRQMALGWLEAAEAAESDAMVMAEMMETVGVDQQTAGAFVAALRKRRSQ